MTNKEEQDRIMKGELIDEGNSLHVYHCTYITDGKKYTLYWAIGSDNEEATIVKE